jgi:hypothetical protein
MGRPSWETMRRPRRMAADATQWPRQTPPTTHAAWGGRFAEPYAYAGARQRVAAGTASTRRTRVRSTWIGTADA